MDGIGTGHFIFAGIFVCVFIAGMAYAYRRDMKKLRPHYRRVWLVLLLIIGIYFLVFTLNKLT